MNLTRFKYATQVLRPGDRIKLVRHVPAVTEGGFYTNNDLVRFFARATRTKIVTIDTDDANRVHETDARSLKEIILV